MKPIFLCGFMGCGKSSIGKRLAKALNATFLDSDRVIEQTAGLRIPEIFAKHGEAYFRDLEYDCCIALRSLQNCVVATGGGMLTFSRCWQALKDHAIIVYLDVPFQICYTRIKDTDRPLVIHNTSSQLEQLYLSRDIQYRAHAHIVVKNQQSQGKTVENILSSLGTL